MSMPSSRLLVATMARSRPALRSDSTWSRCSRDSEPWCARDELFAGQVVEAGREPLGGAARVAEHDRGAVGEDELEHAGVDVRPDALVGLGRVDAERTGRGPRRLRVRARLGHVVDRDDHLDVELLARAGVDDGDGPGAGVGLPAEEARDLVERALRRREADALRWRVGDRVEALERQREVRAALRGRERVDLVDDHGLDAAQDLPRLRREHQVERLGRGDEDVGRRAGDVLAFLRGRVAGAHGHGRRGERLAEPFGRERDAGERRAEVLLDVDGERAQRRDVEDAAALSLGRDRRACRAGRSRRGTRRASCPSRSERAGGCGHRPRSRASPAPARRWARRSSSRTTPGWAREKRSSTPSATARHGTGRVRHPPRGAPARERARITRVGLTTSASSRSST